MNVQAVSVRQKLSKVDLPPLSDSNNSEATEIAEARYFSPRVRSAQMFLLAECDHLLVVYDPNDLTAASRTLPIGSSVIVTNPATGRSAKVRINDRGPYMGGRSLDLSKHAAETIGITDKGVARVKVKRANSKPDTNSSPHSSEDSSSPSPPNSDEAK